MPDEDIEALVSGLIAREIRGRGDTPGRLVAEAVLAAAPGRLERAEETANSARDRQLVAVARAHLDGDGERFDALVRDHLAEYPDSVVAAWIAARASHVKESS